MEVVKIILLTLLVVCAISVSFTKNMLTSVIILMSYSLIMSIIWALLLSPTWPSPRPPWAPVSIAFCSSLPCVRSI